MALETVDNLLAKFGDPGRYQLSVLFMTWIALCTMAFNNLISLFSVGYYPHHCKKLVRDSKADVEVINDLNGNFTCSGKKKITWRLHKDGFMLPAYSEWSLNASIPFLESGELDSCRMYVNPNDTKLGTQNCIYGWDHHPPRNEWTIIQEWDLVCDRRYLSSLTTSLYFMGVTLASPVVGYASDKIGRRPVLLSSLCLHMVVGTAIAFSSNLTMYMVLRAVHGFVLQGVLASSLAMSVEIFQPSKRTLAAIATQILWPTTLILLCAFAYAVGDWRKLQLIITLPGLVMIPYYWLIPESVRWLLAVHKLQKATDQLARFGRYNKMAVPEDLKLQVSEVAAHAMQTRKHAGYSKKYGLKDLYKKRKMRIITCVACYLHFAAVFLYYGISYSIPTVGVSRHVSLGVTASVELVLCTAMYWGLQRFGRRKSAMTSMIVCSIVTITTAIVRSLFPSHPIAQIIFTVLSTMGRASVAVYFTCIPIYTNELFPTVIRSLGYGLCNFFARIGGIIAPQVVLLELYVWTPLPFYFFTIVAAIAAFIIIFLPETLNKALPEIPEDVDHLWMKSSRKQVTQNGNTAEELESL